MKLSLALRSHFGEIKLPGLVGAWMLAAFSVHCLFGGRAMGAALFRVSERIDHASPAFMGEGGHCGLIILARQHLIHAVYFVFTPGRGGRKQFRPFSRRGREKLRPLTNLFALYRKNYRAGALLGI